MITLIIKDGLGNQLFQYSYARYLQLLYGDTEELIINPYYIDRYDFRKVALQHFSLNSNVRFLPESEQRKNMREFKIRVLLSNGLDVLPWKLMKKKPLGKVKFEKRAKKGLYYTYRSLTQFGAPLSKKKDKFVFGCYQGEANFSPIADIIKQELKIQTPPSDENAKMMEEILSTEAVCLHVRRGDYLDDRWKDLRICTFEYYNRAINEVLKTAVDPVFYVFSNTHDDIGWIRRNYHFHNDVDNRELKIVYVDLNNPDYEELRLMQSCKYFIISNSTFSWWAAYLSEADGKMVFVPERWNLNLEDDTSIYLDDWIKVCVN